jgi:hypothetical protein
MKKILALVMTMFVLSATSQTLKHNELTERTECEAYIGSDGIIYKVGDTLKIGMPSGLRSFAFIQSIDFLGTISFATAGFSNTEVVIKKIRIVGQSRTGYKASFQTKATAVSNLFIDFESALQSGELNGKKGSISSADAINELKKAKEKLDLGLITQEEYDKKKAELVKFIK